ncbi:GGDEF domain-containing phosphodiesterase [Paucibacter sp. Y2R2-4]|uniref:GGDEF domain-containing phosphodiesterase n=1 Tax=Paucibacter sp. Y2R2-4 TaxID=2893553 RepID=UPI0021E4E5D5|nr:GGDEF domain-containing phosphodiesterase [Paucibacter sp. Y2R2-4]MCV2350172.1 EAL domain-containing protein [Paucibacter sp. Y2R2-4]
MNSSPASPVADGAVSDPSLHRLEPAMSLGLSDRLIDRMVLIASLVSAACALVLLQAKVYPVSMLVDALAAVGLILLWLSRHRIPSGRRLACLALTGIFVAVPAIVFNPYSPDGYLLVAGVMALSFTNWSGPRALALPVSCVLLLAAVAVGVNLDWIQVTTDAPNFSGRPQAWLIVCLTVVLLGTAMGGAIFELKHRLLGQIELLESGNRKLFRFAYQDAVTGLWNVEFLARELERHRAKGVAHQLMVIELMGLRELSALHGPMRVDQLWREGVELLRKNLSAKTLMLCRLSGDQLAVWAPEAESHRLEEASQAFMAHARSKLSLDRLGIQFHAALVSFPEHGLDLDALRRGAQVALQRAVAQGPGACVAFAAEMVQQLHEEQLLRERVRQALDQDGFYAVYQAKVDREHQQIVGFEGLARMRPVGEEQVPGPATFIGVLHAEGWMTQFGERMLQRILQDVPALCERYGADTQVAANVSPALFLSPSFPDLLQRLLLESGVSPSNLIVEITEEVFVGDLQRLRQACGALRDLGVQVSLDDFGSGFSSLSYLREVHFDEIKIDRSFVQRIETDRRSQMVLSTLCELGRDFDCRVVIEGVETAGQVACISGLHGVCLQGFYFARPQPLEQLLGP